MEDVKSANLLLDHLEQRDNDSYILFDASPRISHIDSRILNRLITKGVIINANEDEIGFLVIERHWKKRQVTFWKN